MNAMALSLNAEPSSAPAGAAEFVARARSAFQSGVFETAAELCRRALELDVRAAGAWHLLGILAAQLGKEDDALQLLGTAAGLGPNSVEHHNDFAVALKRSGRLEEAKVSLERAIELAPTHVTARQNLASVQFELGKGARAARDHARAERHLAAARRHAPDRLDIVRELAATLVDAGRPAEAVPLLEWARGVAPDDPAFACCHGAALRLAEEHERSIEELRAATRRFPDIAAVWNDLGGSLQEQGVLTSDDALLDEADVAFGRAIALVPSDWRLGFNLGLLRLMRGDFAGGLPHYEARFRDGSERLGAYPKPLWRGEPLEGRTVLLHAEQGLGDTLQFVRYAACVRERGGYVVLQCQKPLRALLGGCKGVDTVVDEEAPLPPFDVHAPLLSLPAIFGTTTDTIPNAVPYILPDPELVAAWRARVAERPGLRIGIAWQGNPDFSRDRLRSVPLRHFEPLARIPGVTLYSLQWGAGREQLADFPASSGVIDAALPWSEAAALVSLLDLVVTSDTSIAHLAGALGRPVWVALSANPDFRWQLRRSDCPWYPSMRLFRQPAPHDWPAVFANMARELATMLQAPHS